MQGMTSPFPTLAFFSSHTHFRHTRYPLQPHSQHTSLNQHQPAIHTPNHSQSPTIKMPGNNNSTNIPTQDDNARIQFTQAKSGGDMSYSGFASRAQSAADKAAPGGPNQHDGHKDQGATKK
ncbi:hypothetical protein F5X68DRAFT_213962 [Plectosphaerella plurivora]|uniref:SMP domain-containing protein n=1 Tax=Plectosphaerella plurivora TaxID=936078 RepID=A0A9P9A717_9PEZI|nr:hypothetical protein F5X68DRAFT_213962 [Plectosphaerella plurivora]